MRKDPLQGALAQACKPLPPETSRKDMRQRVMDEMSLNLPRHALNDWHGWPGTWLLADAALNALGYPQDGT